MRAQLEKVWTPGLVVAVGFTAAGCLGLLIYLIAVGAAASTLFHA